jgi:hypothetical protein
MSNKKLLILGVVAAIMVVLTVIVQTAGKIAPQRRSSEDAYVIQGLETSDIAGIVIGAGEDAVRLVRQGPVFAVASKGGYPAVTRKINSLLTTCMTIRTIELITSDPDNHEKLEVTEDKAGSVVKFLDKDEKVITGLVVGKTESPTAGTYVRLVSDNDVYTVKDAPQIQDSPLDYVEKEIVNVDRDDVVTVTVTGPDNSYTLKLEDGNDAKIVLENLPEGKKLKESDAGSVFGALSNLSFQDVKTESQFARGKLQFNRTYVSKLKNSTVYTFDIAKADGETYIKCRAEYTDKGRVFEEDKELEQAEAKLLARQEAVDFTERHKAWIYTIADYKAKNLTKALADILEEPEQDKPEEPKPAEEEPEQDKVPATEDSQQPANEQPQ